MTYDLKKYRSTTLEEREEIARRAGEIARPYVEAETRRWIREQIGAKSKGRMPLPSDLRRDNKISVRLTDAERATLQGVADAKGVSLADALRTLALEAAQKNGATSDAGR
ncbi:MAG: hypothetical protein IJE77_05050 [Thermoguttaceae bacterium]|nr:hypothetical protein [Thermoguttaceae bacterium]MBQ9798845.1 hypothetical protein [Thermoguttaceae bacterium]MBR4834817.1 hypothetical protein [Thermoguttaceae bacterium]